MRVSSLQRAFHLHAAVGLANEDVLLFPESGVLGAPSCGWYQALRLTAFQPGLPSERNRRGELAYG